jgi:hypothetical protein
VEVKDGMVTPVHVALIADGTSLVQTKEETRGSAYEGRYGRNTRFRSDESTLYRVSVKANEPLPYQVKERMSYAH